MDFIPLLLIGIIIILGVVSSLSIAALTPWILASFNKDLINILLLWFFLVLFNRAIGEIDLPGLPNISFFRIVWILLVVAFVFQIILKKRHLLPLTKIEIAMVIFSIIAMASKLFTQDQIGDMEKSGITNVLNGFVFPFSIFVFSKNLIDSDKKIKKVFIFFLILGLYLTLTGICEHYPKLSSCVFPRYIMDPSVGIHWGRARGPFIQAAVNGTVLGIIFLIGVYLCIAARRPGYRNIFGIITALSLVTIYFAYTRACWLGSIISIVILAGFYPKFRKIFAVSLFIVIAIFAVMKNDALKNTDEAAAERFSRMGPIYSRLHIYNASWRMLADKPIFGFGFDTFQYFSPPYFTAIKGVPYFEEGLVSHDTLLGILVELGLAGWGALMVVYFYIFQYSIKLYRHRPGDETIKKLIVIFWGTSGVFLVNMQFIDMRFFLFPNALYFMLSGIIVGLYQRTFSKSSIPGELKRGEAYKSGDNENTAVV